MKLSIIMPEYKQNQYYLKRAIDSIAIQEKVNFNDVEVILAVDGEDKITFPLPPFVRVIQSGEKLGVGKIREFAMKYAIGKWIYFFDSDDTFFTPMSLWYIIDKINKVKNETDMIEYAFYSERHNDIQTSNVGSLYSHAFRKSMLNKYKMTFIDTKSFEDICFITTIINLIGYGKIEGFFDFPIYYYRENLNSISTEIANSGDKEIYSKYDLVNLNYRLAKCKEFNIEPFDYLFIFALIRLWNFGYSVGANKKEILKFIKDNDLLKLAKSRDWSHIYKQFGKSEEEYANIIMTYENDLNLE